MSWKRKCVDSFKLVDVDDGLKVPTGRTGKEGWDWNRLDFGWESENKAMTIEDARNKNKKKSMCRFVMYAVNGNLQHGAY